MLKALSSLLDPISSPEFLSDYYSHKSLYIGSRPDKFKNLFSWGSLNAVLNSSPVPHPTMKMVLEGKQVIATDAESIIERCREGASLVIEEMHLYDKRVGELAAALSGEIGEPTRINLYFSQPSRQGYNRHYDTHDVFILQIAGFKSWKVFDATLQFPLFVQKNHGSSPPTKSRLERTLEAGDVLYIPRGHWHEATAQVEPSLHLTLGIYSRTGIDFLSWLTDELREDVRWRETFPVVPRGEAGEVDDLSPRFVRHFAQLRDNLLSKMAETSLLHEYHKFCVAQERKRNPFAFPEQVLKTPTIAISQQTKFSRPSYQQIVIDRNTETGAIEVTVWGRIIRFSAPAERLIRYVFSVIEFSGKDLLEATSDLSWDDVLIVLEALVREEVIELID